MYSLLLFVWELLVFHSTGGWCFYYDVLWPVWTWSPYKNIYIKYKKSHLDSSNIPTENNSHDLHRGSPLHLFLLYYWAIAHSRYWLVGIKPADSNFTYMHNTKLQPQQLATKAVQYTLLKQNLFWIKFKK